MLLICLLFLFCFVCVMFSRALCVAPPQGIFVYFCTRPNHRHAPPTSDDPLMHFNAAAADDRGLCPHQ